ncbi:Glutamate decarboxylase 1 [Pyrenophora tritici-repentis]|nr:Glutamate decarboxylase 1 [Pyrenophora tritici-repentis]
MASETVTQSPLNRADEVQDLLTAIQNLIIPFIRAADEDALTKPTGHGLQISGGGPRTVLVEHHPPKKLESLLAQELEIDNAGTEKEGGEDQGKDGLVKLVSSILKYSVNTWDQGFLDKLYASTNAVGVVSELLLAVLNTNAHVYTVSPVLTLIEKRTTTYLASLFSLPSSTSGGLTLPGGSASNSTAITLARNTLYPLTKTEGNASFNFTLFTSEHGHYSIEKAANILGFGTKNVITVPVDENGCMIPSALEQKINESRQRGETPLFLNATAGTTVHGSFDPFSALADICKKENIWFHIDGSWGGSVVFSPKYRASRLAGAELADSITINPHKMLGTPMTCSFLLARDMNQMHKALTLPAGYLFHGSTDSVDAQDIYDLGDLSPQCGRRADSLKLFLALKYYGPEHFARLVETAYERAEYLLSKVNESENLVAISPEPLPCLQVCFHYAKGGVLGEDKKGNSRTTTEIAQRLVRRGFMVDFAPGERGKFFRVVVNGGTLVDTLDGLVKAIEESGRELGF